MCSPRRRSPTGWVGVILGNYDDFPLTDMIERETQAVTGQS